jgi:hypothetical protein
MGHALVFRFEKQSVRLDQFLAENVDQLSLSDRLDLVRQIAGSVDYLDHEGIAHRDLKPDNLGVRSLAKGPLRLFRLIFRYPTACWRISSSVPHPISILFSPRAR